MNRIKKIISLLAVCLVVLSCFTSCKNNTDNNNSASDANVNTGSSQDDKAASEADVLFKEYFSKLENEHGKTDATQQIASNTNTVGMTGAVICDLDGDKNYEMITAKATGLAYTEFALEIYNIKENTVTKVCDITDGKTEYSNVFGNNDVYLKKYENKYYICSKVYSATDISGMPCSQSFTIYEYQDSKVKTVCKLSYYEASMEEKEISINDEIVYKSNMYGYADTNYKYTSLDDVIEAFWDELRPLTLDNKIYGERSGNEIIAITFEGCNTGNGETPLALRKELTLQNSLQVQFTNYIFNYN